MFIVLVYFITGDCPIAAPCVAFNVLCLALRTIVGQQGYKFYYSDIFPPCWVTRRHWSHDHKTHSGRFPIGRPLTPTLYLARFPTY